MKKISLFLSMTLAKMAGDTDKVVALNNYRRATQVVKGQLNGLEGQKMDAEIALEEAKKSLEDAKFPDYAFTDGKSYLQNIVNAQKVVNAAEEKLTGINDSIKLYEDLLVEFDQQVDEAPAPEAAAAPTN